jgi:ferredoxin
MIETIISRDFGTPASVATEFVTLQVDGYSVTVPAGTSVMRAAAEHGINIPRLCATDSLEPFGSCRLCLVEIGAAIPLRAPRRPSKAWWCAPSRPSCRRCARA